MRCLNRRPGADPLCLIICLLGCRAVTFASTAATFATTLDTDADCSKSWEGCALLVVLVLEVMLKL